MPKKESYGKEGGAGDDAKKPWQLDICTYITGIKKLQPKSDLSSLFLQLGLDLVQEKTGKSLITGHNAATMFQRPDWDEIFGSLHAAHAGKSIGVFFCGPSRLGDVLKKQCEKFSDTDKNGTRFAFHTEVF